MAYCSSCGSELTGGAKFCTKCGVPVSSQSSGGYSTRQQEFNGKIYKCPNCGEVIKSFTRNCPSCGLEFRTTSASSAVREFAQRLAAIDASTMYRARNRRLFSRNEISDRDEQKINLIRSFSIPNNTEDILEFMILASSNVDYGVLGEMEGSDRSYKTRRAYSDAWLAKIEQAYAKAQNSAGDSADFVRIKKIYEKTICNLRKQKRKRILKTTAAFSPLFLLVAILWSIVGIMNITSRYNEERRLKAIESEIVAYLSRDELVESAAKVSYLYANDSKLKSKWDTIRSSYIKQIQDRSDSGTLLVRPPMNSSDMIGQDCKMIEDLFRMSGFVIVSTEEIKDLLSDEAEYENAIESVRIGAVDVFDKSSSFSFTDRVVIKYHSPNKLKPPDDSSSFRGKYYEDVGTAFVTAGFVNIAFEELHDTDSRTEKGKVKEVSIDGRTSFYSSSQYFADAKVIIRYYSGIE